MHEFCQIQHPFAHSEVLGKLSKEYLNALTCKFILFLEKKS